MSRIRQNYKEETEALVNQQINIQLTASYAYQVGLLRQWSLFYEFSELFFYRNTFHFVLINI